MIAKKIGYKYEYKLEEKDYGDVYDAIREHWIDEDYEDEIEIKIRCKETGNQAYFNIKISDYLTWVEYEHLVRGEL